MGYRWLRKRMLPILCCLVMGAATLAAPSGSPAAEDMFFKGKTIRIVVAFSVGGGFDLYSRTIGRYMGRYIPGNPRFLVQNRTGAGGLISANYVYRKAKPDGLTIGNFPGSLFWARLYGQKGIQFVSSKYEFLGVPESTISICAFTKSSGITDMTKWMNSPRPVKLSGTGPGNSTNDGPRLLNAALGLPIKLIEGYGGAPGMLLAAEKGEVDGICGLSWTALTATWGAKFKSGDAVPVVQTNDPTYRCLPPGVPRIYAHPSPLEIFQFSDRVMIVYEYQSQVRQVFTDGRAHRQGRPQSFMGESIGRWEGDVLVVETANFNAHTWIDRRGVPHSEQLRVVERIHRGDNGQLVVDISVEDPVAFTEPWSARRVFDSVNWRLEESVCVENALLEEFSQFEREIMDYGG